MAKKRLMVLSILLFGIAVILSSQTASVGSISGKVEVQPPGMSWQSATVGMGVPLNAVVSTGFGSQATILMENAEITVRPLTRMTIQELATSGDTTTTKLFLGAGKIRADVKTSGRLINDFQVRSPVATAAVRGTSFTFDGLRIEVVEGSVDFYGSKGGKVNVPPGGKSETSEEGSASDPAETKREETSVSPTTSTGEEGGGGEEEAAPLETARETAPSTTPSATLQVIVQ